MTRITVLHSKDKAEFSASVRSEDQGVNLQGFLFLDYTFAASQLWIGLGEIHASTFAENSRRLPVTWTVPDNLKGCHQLTMVVTHKDNVDFIPGQPRFVDADTAIVTWWVNINPSETDPENLGVCPNGLSPP